MKVKEYVRIDGSIPFKKWFNRLDAQAAAKIVVAIARLEQENSSNIKWFKGLGNIELTGVTLLGIESIWFKKGKN